MFNVPPAVLALIAANVVVHLVLLGVSNDVFAWVMIHLAFIPIRYSAEGLGGWPAWVGPLTYQFLHGGWLHLGINMVMLAALGSGVERLAGRARMLALYFASGVVGAFAHFAVFPWSNVPVVGASGSISGLFGAVLWLMARPNQWGQRTLRFWPAALIWVAISVAIGFVGMPGVAAGQIAWVAHIGGFVAGVAIMMVMVWWARARGPRPPR
jgi:membrane associated rhomboid family serine protease